MANLYFAGDLHKGLNSSKLCSKNFPNYKNSTKDDILLIAGDFGYIWNGTYDKKKAYAVPHCPVEEENIHWYNSHAEMRNIELVFSNRRWGDVLFVEGNHENYELLKLFPIVERYGGKVRKISENVY